MSIRRLKEKAAASLESAVAIPYILFEQAIYMPLKAEYFRRRGIEFDVSFPGGFATVIRRDKNPNHAKNNELYQD